MQDWVGEEDNLSCYSIGARAGGELLYYGTL